MISKYLPLDPCILIALSMTLSLFSIPVNTRQARAANEITPPIEDGEAWYGGAVIDASAMPFGAKPYSIDLCGDTKGNQAQPLLISTHGRYVWCEDPIKFSFENNTLTVSSSFSKIDHGQSGTTLRDAYRYASATYFPPCSETPAPALFTHPQYNTWIELTYDQNESDILKYAEAVKRNGFPTGVLMIDDNWQEDYGTWSFKAAEFEDPKAMIRTLHQQGFEVMLWVCPFVSPDSRIYRDLRDKGLLVCEPESQTEPRMIRWWNGTSASLDLMNPRSSQWFVDELNRLMDEYGVDGFKFDGGDAEHFRGSRSAVRMLHANAQSEAYARIGVAFPLNEYRACWKMAGQPLAQRLRDKRHSWTDLRELIPGTISQGLMGYAYTCPDMIGGGEFGSFVDLKQVDQELVVRSAQCQALMPMMQFSVAPWRVLDRRNLQICVEAARLHESMGEEILSLAKSAAKTGEPIVRPLEYEFPHQGYSSIKDQFMLGSDVMVAPVLEKGATSRRIQIPPGRWLGDDGAFVDGPKSLEIEAPIERLPWYRRSDAAPRTASQ